MEIVIATRNEGKLQEIKELIKGLQVEVLSLKDIPEVPVVREGGSSFRENALMKAEVIASFTKKVSIADDSGLAVDFLKGEPGVYSARFAGEDANDGENNKELLRRLEGVPISKRGATFRCVIAVVTPEGKKDIAEGECRGIIQFEEKGEFGFGYDPLFFVPEYRRTFAELSPEIKNKISHRAKAMEKLRVVLKEYLKTEKTSVEKG
ncbi:MAG: non-canonical purine NTP pyrophosphatase [Deltaproteobacteria bacterium CG12_big_fil_rev_8_21_14_0_65_43_10]|nr:MAG: non-canonical purine NTP pyrophosphatase, RdgB/HAM1 family [Deltaproteobacteria bacterium CG2_30_43_15]PIQ46771.1 MAG: non-canonical purine NTP pyrophosphatase [Deltaproteobacteria bacterium CG12_big_fil_rev_8_21_14_0_65_43_10]PIU86887.1 MAG: non-canonical purine NTP pyrophosphatase [Deltaproteobacteria bacterium CG06_land_8_20_14_3_00_44_19]PIX23424.1 MAG: non-canonical purine NTP pyrophosphatase [Deltaproteobacteria bacterium CG_4_8_14_3_um_filter_43_13]PJB45852.1 MAG: non-canonical p